MQPKSQAFKSHMLNAVVPGDLPIPPKTTSLVVNISGTHRKRMLFKTPRGWSLAAMYICGLTFYRDARHVRMESAMQI